MYLDYTFGIEIECYSPSVSSTSWADNANAVAAALRDRGINCMVEGYNHRVADHWKIVTDSSLGDYVRGIEVVAPVLHGEQGMGAIRTVMHALEDFGCTVSRRCGLHVHVGVGVGASRTMPAVAFYQSLVKTYAYFEPVIDGMMPASRRGSSNGFCHSMTGASFDSINRTGYLYDLQRLFIGGRMHKVNLLAAWQRHTTVEFRQHSGTVSAEKAINWLKLCLKMVDAAKQERPLGTQLITQINRAKPGSKAWLIGELMLRPQGVTYQEARDATGWAGVSLPPQAKQCGLRFTTRKQGRVVRYYAQAAEASATTPATLSGMMAYLDCDETERTYFTDRARNLSGSVQWAA